MALHRLTGITMGVPDVITTAAYYTEFGLTPTASEGSNQIARFGTQDGGEQLTLKRTDLRRLLELGVGVDEPDDLDRVASSLRRLSLTYERTDVAITAVDLGTGVKVNVSIAPRIESRPAREPSYNAPGRTVRTNERADGVTREGPVKPRKLGHVVLGSTDYEASERFFIEGIGFKVSDLVSDVAAFIRCSSDHHNVLIQRAPVSFLHHTSWIVDDVDEIGRGARNMLAAEPARHVWGLGRHTVGSNFFWYLKDPAGNFSEYSSDIDCIVDDALWKPEVWEGVRAMYEWGPPPPPSFLAPDDLAELMAGAHTS
ncbi:dioxygenase [Streptomyces luteolifulvus]|uniref:Dioxygenase n=1 Tax=Streptomyces luteolifulvus TaxID=2615112 RepID=A0A6H9UNB4_9ACTN|nr:VOC family protein [Streptomyces luteolifulvus]KAB1138952.1 dioxygenase [Streptomyces luteolifulvus]